MLKIIISDNLVELSMTGYLLIGSIIIFLLGLTTLTIIKSWETIKKIKILKHKTHLTITNNAKYNTDNKKKGDY